MEMVSEIKIRPKVRRYSLRSDERRKRYGRYADLVDLLESRNLIGDSIRYAVEEGGKTVSGVGYVDQIEGQIVISGRDDKGVAVRKTVSQNTDSLTLSFWEFTDREIKEQVESKERVVFAV